jgi:hypothetical protein
MKAMTTMTHLPKALQATGVVKMVVALVVELMGKEAAVDSLATGFIIIASAAHPYYKIQTLQEEKNLNQQTRRILIISKQHVRCAQSQSMDEIQNDTNAGHITQNELNTHADTCCAGANWSLMELTGYVTLLHFWIPTN